MKRNDLFEAMNGLEDKALTAAYTYKKRRFLWVGAAAACLCLAAGILLRPDLAPAPEPDTGPWPEVAGPTPEPWPLPGRGEDDQRVPGGSSLPEGMDPMTASIAVFPAGRTLEEVDPGGVSLLDLTEEKTYRQEGLSQALPSVLPKGYAFNDSDLYITRMKDGTVYRLLRVIYTSGEPKPMGSAASGADGASTPAYYPADQFSVTVTDFEPNTEKPIYRPEEITEKFLNSNSGATFHVALADCWIVITPTSLTTAELTALMAALLN